MKHGASFVGILFSIIFSMISHAQQDEFPVLKGPYLGQKPPGMVPEIFAPGVVSTEKSELNSVFSPDGKEFFFARRNGNILVMYSSQEIDGIWTKPEAFPYCEGNFNGDMNFSPDGKRLYYCSDRKVNGYLGDLDIWYCERTETGWSEPVHLGPRVNSSSSDTYPVFTRNGGLYFGSNREGGMGDKDLYYTRFVEGAYTQPVPLGDAINSKHGEGDTYVDFGESFMIINTWGRPDCLGSGDLYISFKLENGVWSRARNMGERINTEFLEYCPMLSPDGKYLFFTSGRRGNGDIYWIDAKIIEDLRPEIEFPVLEGPYLGQKAPGMTPEVFAPGIISTKNYNEALFCAYMDGNSLFLFTRSSPGSSGQIYYPIHIMELKDGEWTQPYLASFHNKPCDQNLSIIPDGKTLYFGSRRSKNGRGESPKGFNIWVVKKSAEGFSNPRMLDPPVNSDAYDIYPSATKDGTLYFFSERSGGFGHADIYRSRLVDGKYANVENIGPPVNTENSEIDPFIAADESYLIYCSQTLGGFGGYDLYITFRKQDGSWTGPVNMGPEINSSANDWVPYVTSDGKYFFFTSERSGDYDIYWIDAKIIEELRPKQLK